MERDEILARLRERIVSFAASRIQGDLAEDLAQEVLIVLEQKYAHVTALDELLPLSLQILRFKMAGVRRKAQRRGEAGALQIDDLQLADPGANPETYAQRQELLERLERAIPKLGERCREIFEDIRLTAAGTDRFDILSMGMSGDYEVAIECGANMVRVGSAIFGPPRAPESDDVDSAENH